jgi:RNA polymerase sigma factor (sigma-70 family)
MSTLVEAAALDTSVRPQAMRYQPGSITDFDRLYRDSRERVLRVLLSMLHDVPSAEDCLQEAFVRALRAWPRWRPDAPAEAWLVRIAINVAISYRRRERLHALGETVRRLGHSRDPEPAAEGAWTSDLLAALRRLPPHDAAVIVLRFSHGYTNREMAVAFGVPESTISSRLGAARDRLRAELDHNGNNAGTESLTRAHGAL